MLQVIMVSSDSHAGFSTKKWLAVVGIGEDGLSGLGETACRLIAEADVVFGGHRHLHHAASTITGRAVPWPSPFDTAMKAVLAERGLKVCVLASGDPFHFGVGTTLARHVDPSEMIVLPAPSTFSLAAARLGWALNEVETISLHGQPIERIRPLLHPGRRIIALTSDGSSPASIARLLVADGFANSHINVLESLGGGNEQVVACAASELASQRFGELNVVTVDVRVAPDARILPLGFGLDDALFLHDGQITKREIRAVTLSALAPRRGELLWDIGAGSGSIAIEWMLSHPSMRAIAIERNAARIARIRENAARFGIPSLRIVEGAAPGACEGLQMPDAIFIGGGGSRDGIVDFALEALRPGGRLVANAVTLEMEAMLLGLHGRLGGRLTRISIASAEPVGTMSGWRPAMPVTQWAWVKP
ncbi:precorrin-6y C5,15-methyltransferase (decarboxylating) subunit CbiE [Nitratireductor aestuarii]|nr:precorrin-6y C5,15-methyltransferase (decarboxylating) subunit CbiE [Nitratireductor aestuarii]